MATKVARPQMAPSSMATNMATVTMPNNKRSAADARPTSEVPIFLQKAYHMIDTCDPTICSWSEDGLTFIVKNTSLFETVIIPQFFKHNKFSSFVRQLNFYGFRKVKFSNSLKIDRELEAATAKFWRFRHDKFRRGRRDLLSEIKRTPNAATKVVNKAVAPGAVMSSTIPGVPPVQSINNKSPKEVSDLKKEMEAMKRRMASMTKNIDELTDLVNKVSVNDNGGASPMVSPGAANAAKLVEPEMVGSKRKKMEGNQTKQENSMVAADFHVMPDWNPSSSDLGGADSLFLGGTTLPDTASSGGLTPPAAASPIPSDDTFVDDLFRAFADDDAVIPGMESMDYQYNEVQRAKRPAMHCSNKLCPPVENPNKPCPRLMKRIEDSLSTIPKEMHKMVADRLIDAIADSRPIAEEASCFFASGEEEEAAVDDRGTSTDEDAAVDAAMDAIVQPQPVFSKNIQAPAIKGAQNVSPAAAAPSIPLPLAAAALKTILSEYGMQVEVRRAPCKEASMEGAPLARSLPVVPLHA